MSDTKLAPAGHLSKISESLENIAQHWPTQRGLYEELKTLSKYISSTRDEISGLVPTEVNQAFIPQATDELDAVVAATADATNSIMDATEVIESVAPNLSDEHQSLLSDATMKIYEACSFQDITGQRITKVVALLKHIEEKVESLTEAFGGEIDAIESLAKSIEEKSTPNDESALLNGPALNNTGIDQSAVDALLAELDG